MTESLLEDLKSEVLEFAEISREENFQTILGEIVVTE